MGRARVGKNGERALRSIYREGRGEGGSAREERSAFNSITLLNGVGFKERNNGRRKERRS
jgi:hypothetical protein